MALFSGLTTAGAEALSAGVGFAGNLLGSGLSALYNANQSKINRKFQERMYNKQVEDSINFWKMQQEYNTPANQLQRIVESGLSPLLAYGDNGLSGNIAGSAPSLPSAPHGAQAQSAFNTRIDMANLALVEAQAKVLESQANKNDKDAALTESQTEGQNIYNWLNDKSKNIQLAIKFRDWDYLNTQIDSLRNNMWNQTNLTNQECLTMMQGRLYQIKHYNLDEWSLGEQFKLSWEHLDVDRLNANANWKNALSNWQHAVNETRLFPYQIGVMAKNAFYLGQLGKTEQSLRPWRVSGARFENIGKVLNNFNTAFDYLIHGANLQKTQAETLKLKLETVQKSFGVDSPLGGLVAPFTVPIGRDSNAKNYNELKNQGW